MGRSDVLRVAWKYIIRALDYLFWAAFFGLLTLWYWFIADGSMLVAYFWNMVGISAALIIDRIRMRRIDKKIEAAVESGTPLKVRETAMGSLKPSLYLLYALALAANQVYAMGSALEISESVQNYLTSVSYGLILLFALDMLIGSLASDEKRVQKLKSLIAKTETRDNQQSREQE